MIDQVNLLTAALAGLLSFFSPCTLPLVPLFLAHLTGVTGENIGRNGAHARLVLLRNAAAFVLGFSLVFIVLFGLSAGLLAGLLRDHRDVLLRVGGAFLVVLGLNYLGALRVPGLQREWRPLHRWPAGRGATSSFVVGATFALGWTPCIGTALAAIMALAVTSGGTAGAVTLLTAYSLGLGLPFLVVAAGFGRMAPALRRFGRHLPALTRLSGSLVLAVGAFMSAGAYQDFFVRLIRFVPWTPPL